MLRRPKEAPATAVAQTNDEATPTAAPPGLAKRMLSVLGKLPWAKLRPRVPSLKKVFAPFLLVILITLLTWEASIVLTMIRGSEKSGKEISITRLYEEAANKRVKRAVFKEQDANLLLRIEDPPISKPAPAPEVAPPADPNAPPASTPPAPPAAAVTDPNAPPAPPPTILVPGKVKSYWTAYPASDAQTGDLTEKLIESGAEITHDHQSGKRGIRYLGQFLLPLLILAAGFGLIFLVITGQGGGSDFLGFSKFASKVQRRKKGTKGAITFADVAGNEESLTELKEVVDYLMNPQQFAELGARAPKGVLLAGPPGTGKTLLAKAVAGEAAVPFIQLSGSEFVESLVGVGAARVRDLFKQARELAPCIIFIDELDAAGRQRGAGVGGGNDEREQTLNQLLVEMDGFAGSLGIAVLGATNRPDILDPALLRPGRFDRQIVIDVPDVKGRTAILQIHTKKRPLADDVDLEQISKQVPGFTGAELANVINEAALLTVRGHRHEISQQDLEEAVDRVLAGPERRSHILTQDEKLLIAYHEAGHAVVARGCGQTTGVLKLSIVARGLQLGHASTYSSADRLVQLETELQAQLTTFLGGLAAEKLVFGQMSTGNAGDLEKATTLARKMVATWGMSPEVGRVQVLNEGAVFMGRDFAAASHTSANALNKVDAEVRRVLDEAEQDAVRICRMNRKILDTIVGELLQRETMVGPELEPLLEQVKALKPATSALALLQRPSNGGGKPRSRGPRVAAVTVQTDAHEGDNHDNGEARTGTIVLDAADVIDSLKRSGDPLDLDGDDT
ncbi:MAG TPA: ATP-dependent zinc metalloprotease FtsH [Acidimicrobiales bacterium]